MKFCNNCEHLSPTEEEQSRVRAKCRAPMPHVCMLLKCTVKHGIYHPSIPAGHDCPLRECVVCNHIKAECICTSDMFDNVL